MNKQLRTQISLLAHPPLLIAASSHWGLTVFLVLSTSSLTIYDSLKSYAFLVLFWQQGNWGWESHTKKMFIKQLSVTEKTALKKTEVVSASTELLNYQRSTVSNDIAVK